MRIFAHANPEPRSDYHIEIPGSLAKASTPE